MDQETNPTAEVNPSAASVEAFARRPDANAFIMVNLLKFNPDGGREAYARYGAVASGTVKARGGSIAYSAPVIGDENWDQATLVRYPRRAAYLDMQSDPAYVGAIPDRTSGLAARLLYPFHDPAGDPDDRFRIERSGGDEVFVVRLGRRPSGDSGPANDDAKTAGELVLRLYGDTPMVSDDRWDELTVTRYPSRDAVEIADASGEGSSPSIDLVTKPTP